MAKNKTPKSGGKVPNEDARAAGRYGLRIFALSPSEWMILSRETGKQIAGYNPKTGFPSVAGRNLPKVKNVGELAELLLKRFPNSVHDPNKKASGPPAAQPPAPVQDPPFCRATVDEDGNLSCEYRHEPGGKVARDGHDEDVSDWTDDQIKDTVRRMIDLDPSVEIELDNMAIPSDLRDDAE